MRDREKGYERNFVTFYSWAANGITRGPSICAQSTTRKLILLKLETKYNKESVLTHTHTPHSRYYDHFIAANTHTSTYDFLIMSVYC